MHCAARECPLDCSFKLTNVLPVKLCSLMVERILRVWFVEKIDKPVDHGVDIQYLSESSKFGGGHGLSIASQNQILTSTISLEIINGTSFTV